jgi:predicted TPR repeat methyltransferase
LVYVGQLEGTVAAARTALKPGGHFIFTLEYLANDSGDRGYRLMPSGRFSHSAAYVSATVASAGLLDTVMDPIVPRLECGEPVHGLLVVAGYTVPP